MLGDLFTDTVELEPVILDRSTLENTANCPYMAHAIASGDVEDVSYFGLAGSEGHDVLRKGMAVNGDGVDAMIAYLEAEMQTSRPDLQPEVVRALKGLSQTLHQLAGRRILATEKQFSVDFMGATDQRGKVILTCCQDLLVAGKDSTILHIHDWKTGWKRIDKATAADMFQTQFYSWVIWKNYPEVQEIHFWYEQTRFDDRTYVSLNRDRDFYNFEGRIQKSVELHLSGNREAWPYPEKCAWCPATKICPYVTSEAKEINDDPQGYLKHYIALAARIDVLTKTMKQYCKKHGEIRDGDQVFGYKSPALRVAYKLYTDEPKTCDKTE